MPSNAVFICSCPLVKEELCTLYKEFSIALKSSICSLMIAAEFNERLMDPLNHDYHSVSPKKLHNLITSTQLYVPQQALVILTEVL